VHRGPKNHDYMRDLMLTVLDFHMKAEVVGTAINYFRDRVQPVDDIHTHEHLTQTLACYADDQEGNVEASLYLWSNRHWQRAHLLRGLLAFLASIGVTDQPGLRRWASTADFEKDFQGKVKGLGLAVFQWLLIRCGVPTIKPDVHVISFAQRITGKKLADTVLVALFNEISPLVGQSMTTIDQTIWSSERMGLGKNDLPGLRVVFWRLLKEQLKARICPDQAEKNLFSRFEIDPTFLLRYDAAGIRMTRQAMFGGTGKAVVSVVQTNWRDRFRVRMTINQAALAAEAFDAVKAKMESLGWVVTNSGDLAAWVDLNMELFMPPTMTTEIFLARVDSAANRIIGEIAAAGTVVDHIEGNGIGALVAAES
ncbi:MAG: hypothetical protein NTX56_07880, partial [Proteobacteria bacterium]|nr:hypothetical protein [Pseudomonadota bacterium]